MLQQKLDRISLKLKQSTQRAINLTKKRSLSLAIKSKKVLEVQTKQKDLNEIEEVKELINLKALSDHIEKTRVLAI